MAIDYIIGALQLLSAAVNVLALASFWITPGLRTTANRFVINLLIVNIVGCLALTPALWLNGGLIPKVHSESKPIYDSDDDFHVPSIQTLPNHLNASTIFNRTTTTTTTTLIEVSPTKRFDENDVDIVGGLHGQNGQRDRINQTNEINDTWSPTKNIQYSDCTRFWGFDLVAALGKLFLN